MNQPFDLEGIRAVGVAMGNDAHKRSDHMPRRHGHHIVEPSDDLHILRAEPDLLLGLSQGRGQQIPIPLLETTTREADLPLVCWNQLCPLGKDEVEPRIAHRKGEENRRLPELGMGGLPCDPLAQQFGNGVFHFSR